MAQVPGRHEHDRPSGRREPVQPAPIRGHLLGRLTVPDPVVLDGDLDLRPREIDAGDEAGSVAHDELGDRSSQRGSVQQEPELRLLR